MKYSMKLWKAAYHSTACSNFNGLEKPSCVIINKPDEICNTETLQVQSDCANRKAGIQLFLTQAKNSWYHNANDLQWKKNSSTSNPPSLVWDFLLCLTSRLSCFLSCNEHIFVSLKQGWKQLTKNIFEQYFRSCMQTRYQLLLTELKCIYS